MLCFFFSEMITVEELIVQSLYHRLVLITVRRTNDTSSDEQGDSVDGDVVGAVAAQQSKLPDSGLGNNISKLFVYLCLFELKVVDQDGEEISATIVHSWSTPTEIR